MSAALSGTMLTPEGWLAGRLELADGRIAAVRGERLQPGASPEPPLLVPGFIDLHVHGGGGADAMEGEEAVRAMCRFHARHGTTTLAPTTVCAPPAEIEAALAGIEAVRRHGEEQGAAVLGAHLEGPFINPRKLGAQPPFARTPDAALARRWCGIGRIAVATLAPELEGGRDLVRALCACGCTVQIGHSLATADEAAAALDAGASGFTHLFNAMSGLDHRDPGVAAAALAFGRQAEIIADLQHVAPAMILAAARAIPNLYAVTDSIAAAGGADGRYRLGRHSVVKSGDRVTLGDGRTLAGSVLTMDRALANLAAIGLPLATALAMLAARPAAHLGLADRGRLAAGARADIVRLDADLAVEAVWIGGTAVADAGG